MIDETGRGTVPGVATSQSDLFGGAREAASKLPEGFSYRPELIGPDDEHARSRASRAQRC